MNHKGVGVVIKPHTTMSDLAPLIAPVRADLGRVERPRQDGMTDAWLHFSY
ncbi:MAG: hypothetical protein HOH42_10060 [Ilumatobacter sp.]|jgi:hypothetical protein|uniref:hypothetical protein n=1 Tax=Ilumatobacter sp. TaxID=1967498 RepID=UPI0037539AC9|nr:hypothetical protein [Ilumatobacter sp.]MBT7428689.1 hypothetical protein [Ilumatobacter sp.]